MRRATLGLLTRFHQPAATHISANEVGGPSTVLHALQGLEAQHAALSNSKSAPAAIEQLQTAFEFKKIPTLLVDPVVRSLLGLLNIRYVRSRPPLILAGPMWKSKFSEQLSEPTVNVQGTDDTFMRSLQGITPREMIRLTEYFSNESLKQEAISKPNQVSKFKAQ